jgi:hypothetical protein
MAEAARMLAEAPGALHLRTLQSLNDLSSDQSNTVVFAMPIEVLRAVEGMSNMLNHSGGQNSTAPNASNSPKDNDTSNV